MTMTSKNMISRRLGALVLSATLLTGLLAVSSSAATVSSVTAQLSPQLNIVVDGVDRTFYTAGGDEAHPITYGGTTYLPIRAIGELMGKNVNWDQSTLTVTLSGTRTTAATAGTPDTTAVSQNISAQLRPDFTIVVDGSVCTFRDANNNVVYPLLYNGSTYLPVRAIGELMGKSVSWDGTTGTVTLAGDSLVTDADSFNQNTTPTKPSTGTASITAEQAKAAALNHAGLTSSQVTFIQSKLDWEDGRQVYDVEFYTADYKEYDYEIDASTGEVVKYDYDAEHYTRPQDTSGTQLSTEQAKDIALAQVPGASDSNVRKAHLDRDDGRTIYEVEILYNAVEYDFEIDAYSGEIISYDYESIYD